MKSVINRLIPAKANHEAIEVLFVLLYLNFPKGPCLMQVKEHLDPVQTYLVQIDLASLVTHYKISIIVTSTIKVLKKMVTTEKILQNMNS